MTVTKEELHLVIKRKSPVIGHKVPFRGASKAQNKGTKNVGVSFSFPWPQFWRPQISRLTLRTGTSELCAYVTEKRCKMRNGETIRLAHEDERHVHVGGSVQVAQFGSKENKQAS